MNLMAPEGTADGWLESDAVEPPECAPLTPLGERVAPVIHALTATPGTTAATTIGVISILVGILALRPVAAAGADQHGSFVAHCGIGYYLFGHPNPFVTQTCSQAYSGHAAAALASTVVLTVMAAIVLSRVLRGADGQSLAASVGEAVRGTRRGAALASVALASLIIMIGALRTVPVLLHDQAGPLMAHCGLSYEFVGTDHGAVQTACRKAFATHADVAGAAFASLVVSGGALVLRARPARRRADLADNRIVDVGGDA